MSDHEIADTARPSLLSRLDKIATASGVGTLAMIAIAAFSPQDLLDKVGALPPSGRIGVGVISTLLAIGLMRWIFASLKSDHSDSFKRSLEQFLAKQEAVMDAHLARNTSALEETRNEADSVVSALKNSANEITTLTHGLAPLVEKVEQSHWYLNWDRFQAEEASLRELSKQTGNSVKAYIVSRTLKFDADDKLFPQVAANVYNGAEYWYIIPKEHGVDAKFKALKKAVNDRAKVGSGVGRTDPQFGKIDHCHTDDGSLFAEMAIFEFTREIAGGTSRQDYQAFMAIDDHSPNPPWLRLSKTQSEWIWSKVTELVDQSRPKAA